MSASDVLGTLQHQLHVVEIAPRGVQYGEPRGEGLDGEPRLDQLNGTDLIGKVVRLAAGGRLAPTKVPLPSRRDTRPAFSS